MSQSRYLRAEIHNGRFISVNEVFTAIAYCCGAFPATSSTPETSFAQSWVGLDCFLFTIWRCERAQDDVALTLKSLLAFALHSPKPPKLQLFSSPSNDYVYAHKYIDLLILDRLRYLLQTIIYYSICLNVNPHAFSMIPVSPASTDLFSLSFQFDPKIPVLHHFPSYLVELSFSCLWTSH